MEETTKELFNTLLSGFDEIKEELKTLSQKFDKNTTQTTINTENIKSLSKNFEKFEEKISLDLIHIHQKLETKKIEAIKEANDTIMLKFYGSLFASISAIATAIIAIVLNIKIK